VPAYIAGQLLAKAAPELALQLKSIEYAPVCVVGSAYERSQVGNALDTPAASVIVAPLRAFLASSNFFI
jgi:hypothetical protein